MFRFTTRDVLWLTVVVALAAGWWMDRSSLAWRRTQALRTIDSLRQQLDAKEPGWRNAPLPHPPPLNERDAIGGLVLGLLLFGATIWIFVLVWQGQLHWSLLTRRRW